MSKSLTSRVRNALAAGDRLQLAIVYSDAVDPVQVLDRWRRSARVDWEAEALGAAEIERKMRSLGVDPIQAMSVAQCSRGVRDHGHAIHKLLRRMPPPSDAEAQEVSEALTVIASEQEDQVAASILRYHAAEWPRVIGLRAREMWLDQMADRLTQWHVCTLAVGWFRGGDADAVARAEGVIGRVRAIMEAKVAAVRTWGPNVELTTNLFVPLSMEEVGL
jgi:hypothetical protein